MQITQRPAPAVLLENTADTTSLLLSFREDVPNPQRRPLNVALVIDRSGSMAGTPLRYALKAAADFVDRLTADDRLSIVVYDDHVDTLLAAQLVTDKAAIKNILGGVRAGGITNLSGGWLRGCELVAQHKSERHVNRVLLLTDGQANAGIIKSDVLISTAGKKAEEGISTTLGFGEHFEEDLLIGMARAAAGNFYFIQSLDDAADVFGAELDSLKSVAAQNLTVTLHPLGDVKLTDVLSLARTEPQADGRLVVRLGDVFENEDKLLGLQLTLPALPAGPHDLIRLSYRADAVRNGAIETLSGDYVVRCTAAAIEAVAAATDSRVTLELALLRVGRDKERAVDLADHGQHAEAEALLRQVVADLTRAGLHEHFEVAEEIDQLTHYAERIAKRHLDNASRKELRDQAFQGRQSRQALAGRGLTVDAAAYALPVVSDVAAGGVELLCFREGGKLRMKVVSPGFADLNVQFPRAIRAEGAHYLVEALEPSADGTFYRTQGIIQRLVRPGETDPLGGGYAGSGRTRSASPAATRPARTPQTLADLQETDTVGQGILVQVVKDKSKLRARVVSDGFDPNWNMRFPRDIRQENQLYVVDQVNPGPGNTYIASGDIKRFVQPV